MSGPGTFSLRGQPIGLPCSKADVRRPVSYDPEETSAASGRCNAAFVLCRWKPDLLTWPYRLRYELLG